MFFLHTSRPCSDHSLPHGKINDTLRDDRGVVEVTRASLFHHIPVQRLDAGDLLGFTQFIEVPDGTATLAAKMYLNKPVLVVGIARGIV